MVLSVTIASIAISAIVFIIVREIYKNRKTIQRNKEIIEANKEQIERNREMINEFLNKQSPDE